MEGDGEEGLGCDIGLGFGGNCCAGGGCEGRGGVLDDEPWVLGVETFDPLHGEFGQAFSQREEEPGEVLAGEYQTGFFGESAWCESCFWVGGGGGGGLKEVGRGGVFVDVVEDEEGVEEEGPGG